MLNRWKFYEGLRTLFMDQSHDFNLPDNSGKLIAHDERSSAAQTPIDMGFLFSKDARDDLEFEIVFITLVTTSVLSVPQTGTLLDQVAILAVFALLLLTVVRRMAVGNSWVDIEQIYSSTFGWIWLISVFSVSYAVLSLSQWTVLMVLNDTPIAAVYLIWGVSLVLLILTVTVAYEFYFGDLAFWAAILFYNTYARSDSDLVFWLAFSNVMLNMSVRDTKPDHYAIMKIRHRYNGSRNMGLEAVGGKFLIAILVVIVTLIGMVIAYPYSALFGSPLLPIGIVMTASVSATLATTAVLSFLYQRYGTTNYKQTPVWTRGLVIVYATLIIHTVGQTGWNLNRVEMFPPLI